MKQVMSAISARLAARMAAETLRRLRERCRNVSRMHRKETWLISGPTACARDHSAEAELEIILTNTWMLVPPLVKAKAVFMRNHPNWHVIGDEMCYVHHNEWYDSHVAAVDFFRSKDPGPALEWSTCWLLDAIDNLVHKHFLGWQAGLKDWPKEWNDWKHGTEGIRQYEEEKKAYR